MLIQAARALVDEGGFGRLREDVWLELTDGRIATLGRGAPPGQPDVVLGEGLLSPGLIDGQLNGAFGHDLVTADETGWGEVLERLPGTGVTTMVPTFITAPIEDLVHALRREREHRAATAGVRGSRRAGIHLEGPFLAATRRGAHPAQAILDPDPGLIERLLTAADGGLSHVTLAPERPGGLAAIAQLRAADVRVAVGHSDATDAEVLAAVDTGASLVTHLYNAQRPLHHRDPGVVGAALADPRLFLGLIVDGHHVAPMAVRVAFAAAAERIMLVTDGMAALGMPPGSYVLGDDTVEVAAHAPPRRHDGTIAGSSVSLDEALRTTVACGIDLEVALRAATQVPADALGLAGAGRLRVGDLADLVWFDDDLLVRATLVGGVVVAGTLETP